MGLITTKLNTSLDVIKTYLDTTMHEPCNELYVDKPNRIETYEYLHNETSTLSSYLKGYTDTNQYCCEIINDDHLVLHCKGYGEGLGHKYLHIEKVSCDYRDEDACRHCCRIEKESNECMCMPWYKNKLLNGSGHYGKKN